jgi:hypothetical protein
MAGLRRLNISRTDRGDVGAQEGSSTSRAIGEVGFCPRAYIRWRYGSVRLRAATRLARLVQAGAQHFELYAIAARKAPRRRDQHDPRLFAVG